MLLRPPARRWQKGPAVVYRPALYRPAPPLAEYVEFFGHWRHRGPNYRSRALPRGAVTIVFDVGRRQQLDFYTADGRTRLPVPPAVVAGPHRASYITDIAADEPAMAIHFRPGGAFPFLGVPLGDVEDQAVGLEEIWGRGGREVHERLIAAPSVAARFGILEEFLLSRARFAVRRDPRVAAALAAIEADPSVRMAEVRRLTGWSTKRMIAQFRAEVGLAPKTYARVRRLQAALRRLGEGTAGGARLAADAGYFDQAHFVRDFRSFTAMTPTQYGRQRLVLPSHVPVARHKYAIPAVPGPS
ncbi:AraC family transcriptional regulator [Mycobacterium paraense]|uniref:AraC family transcriptional regulator n=1 Tax=Mycobacterium paraense TaxID=767916 RepID=A0A1X2AGD2_9MYCO|nr:AraC family transcriptional regulator [Mycobacterium paraense]